MCQKNGELFGIIAESRKGTHSRIRVCWFAHKSRTPHVFLRRELAEQAIPQVHNTLSKRRWKRVSVVPFSFGVDPIAALVRSESRTF